MVKIIAVSVTDEEFEKITGFCKMRNVIRSGLMRDLTLRYINKYINEAEKWVKNVKCVVVNLN